MALMYTGRADVLQLANGDKYANAKEYKRSPDSYKGSFEKPIPISEDEALYLADVSSLHSFSNVRGEDLMEAATAPNPDNVSPADIVSDNGGNSDNAVTVATTTASGTKK